MRAQLSLEFLINFTLMLSLISLLSVSLFYLADNTKKFGNFLYLQTEMESYARMLDGLSSSSGNYGKSVGKSVTEKNYREPKNSSIEYVYNERIISTKVITGGSSNEEPI